MSVSAGRKAPRESLNIRIRPEDRRLIDRAASARKEPHRFILDAARQAAEEALLERAIISVDPEDADFVARLDAPAQPNELLRRTMQMPAPWDKE